MNAILAAESLPYFITSGGLVAAAVVAAVATRVGQRETVTLTREQEQTKTALAGQSDLIGQLQAQLRSENERCNRIEREFNDARDAFARVRERLEEHERVLIHLVKGLASGKLEAADALRTIEEIEGFGVG